MDDNQKNEFDALSVLRRASWNSFNERRVYEWKFSLALWAVYAAFIGSIITGKFTFNNYYIFVAVLVGVIIFLLFIYGG